MSNRYLERLALNTPTVVQNHQKVIKRKDIFYEESLYSYILGSPITSIAAAICSEALEKPIRITFETIRKGTVSIVLEVVP